MKYQAVILGLLMGLALSPGRAAASDAPAVGVRTVSVFSKARNEPLSVTIWYPAGPGGEADLIGDDRIFAGTPALRDAPARDGGYPLVVFSHGSGATVEKMSWIAADLAAKGYVVAGPNHPGTTSGDSTPEDTPKLWERTDDLTEVISFLLEAPEWKQVVDADRVAALGFSLGGAAVLELVGAEGDLEAYAGYCETYPGMPDCRWFAGGHGFRDGVALEVPPLDLRTVDEGRFEAMRRDERVKAVVAVDPSLALAFKPESLAALEVPVTFVNLGAPGTVPVAVAAGDLAELVPGARIANVEGAVHFSFMPECKASAAAFMAEIGEPDALCTDGGTRSRTELHRELERLIGNAFAQMLTKE